MSVLPLQMPVFGKASRSGLPMTACAQGGGAGAPAGSVGTAGPFGAAADEASAVAGTGEAFSRYFGWSQAASERLAAAIKTGAAGELMIRDPYWLGRRGI